MHANNIELQGLDAPSSISFQSGVSRKRFTYPIWDVNSREAEDIVLGALEQANPRDPHGECWPLQVRR